MNFEFTGEMKTTFAQSLASPCTVFLLGAPMCIFLHECAHYGVAIAHGCDAQLYAMYTQFSGTFDDQESADKASLLITSAGPLVQVVSVLIGTIGLIIHARKPPRNQENSSVGFWILSFLAFSGLRWLQTPFRGPITDEATISRLLGYSPKALPAWLFLIAIAICIFQAWIHYRNRTLKVLTVAIPSAVIGATLWAFVLGPRLLY